MSLENLSKKETLEKWSDFRKYLHKDVEITLKHFITTISGNFDEGEDSYDSDVSFIKKTGRLEKAYVYYDKNQYPRGLRFLEFSSYPFATHDLMPTSYEFSEYFRLAYQSKKRFIVLDKLYFPETNEELRDLDLDITSDGFKNSDYPDHQNYPYPHLAKKSCYYDPFTNFIKGKTNNLLTQTLEIPDLSKDLMAFDKE